MFRARRLAPLALLALWSLGGCSTLAPADRAGRHVLWEVRDQRHVVYLLGSVHVMPASVHPLDAVMEKAFADADELVLEIDLSGRSGEDVGAELEKLGTYPKGDALRHHLTQPAQDFLTEFLPLFGTTLDQVNRYRPWFLADALSARYLEQQGLRSELGIDNYFLRKAKLRHLPVSGLEEMSAQTALNMDGSDREAEAYLLGTLLNLREVEHTIQRMARAWRHGDLAGLNRLIEEQAKADPKLTERMFAVRNRQWLPAIEQRIRGQRNVLIVVGAGHLIGPKGIVALLRAKGYEVRRL